MITNKDYFAQLPKEIKQGFSELNIGYHLRKVNITKLSGYSCLTVFKLIFLLVFQYKNWFRAFMRNDLRICPERIQSIAF